MSIFAEGWNGECLENYAPIRVLGVDTVSGELPGSLRVLRDEELLRAPPIARTNPHEPGLREALMATELTDSSPKEILLIGVVPETTAAGTALSSTVEAVIPDVLEKLLEELHRLGAGLSRREHPDTPDLWWH